MATSPGGGPRGGALGLGLGLAPGPGPGPGPGPDPGPRSDLDPVSENGPFVAVLARFVAGGPEGKKAPGTIRLLN